MISQLEKAPGTVSPSMSVGRCKYEPETTVVRSLAVRCPAPHSQSDSQQGTPPPTSAVLPHVDGELTEKSLLDAANITHGLEDQHINEISHSDQDNDSNETKSYSGNDISSRTETIPPNEDRQNETVHSTVNSEYEVVIEILGDTNQTLLNNTTKEVSHEFVFMSQAEHEDAPTNINVLHITEILPKINKQLLNKNLAISVIDDIQLVINSDEDTSTESETQSSTEQIVGETASSNEDTTLTGEGNDSKHMPATSFVKDEHVRSEDNAEASTNKTGHNDIGDNELYVDDPKKQIPVDVLNLPPIVCNPEIFSREGMCVPWANARNNSVIDKSTFSLPCPPGTGRAADNTCQSRA